MMVKHAGANDPQPVSATEYVFDVIRAYQSAGLTVDHKHMYMVQQKLLNESSIPKFKALQVLSKLHDAVAAGKDTIEVSVSDIRLLLQVKGTLTESN